jgi:hypothetical protein
MLINAIVPGADDPDGVKPRSGALSPWEIARVD